MRYLVCLWLTFLSLNCQADWDDWSESNKIMFGVSTVAIMGDWATTRYYSRHLDILYPQTQERNIILGPRPSTNKVDIYFTTMVVTNYFIADRLSKDFRNTYFTIRILSHGYATKNNIELGWRMQF